MSHTLNLPTYTPTEIVIGTTLEWEKEFADFPADEWTVTYYFRGVGTGFDVAGTADNSIHVFNVAASVTDDLTAGRYDYQGFAVKGDEKHLVDEGITTAKKSLAALATTTTHDGTSQNQKILAAIDNLMQGKAAVDSQRYLVATGVPGFSSQREAERIDPLALLKLRQYYAALVASEKAHRKKSAFATIKTHLRPPS